LLPSTATCLRSQRTGLNIRSFQADIREDDILSFPEINRS
jgi:hypothetical protein